MTFQAEISTKGEPVAINRDAIPALGPNAISTQASPSGGLSVPILSALPLHGDAGGIADLIPFETMPYDWIASPFEIYW
jgi:hypothetical protein